MFRLALLICAIRASANSAGTFWAYSAFQFRVNGAAFRSGNRHARVIEIPGATHYLFLSNQAETLRDIPVFVTSLR
jgi:hypothetical protein